MELQKKIKNYMIIVYFVHHVVPKIIFTVCKLTTKIDALNVKKCKMRYGGGQK